MGAEKREREDIENSAAQPETKQVKAEVDALGADGSILAVNCCTVEPDPDTGAASFKCRHPGCDRRYASRDAVRKHCRLRHGDWLKEQGKVASQSPDHPPPKPTVPKPFLIKKGNAHMYDSPALYSMPSESLYTLPAFELLDPDYFCPHSSPGSEEDDEPFLKSPRFTFTAAPAPAPADPQPDMGRALKALLASGLL